MNDSIDSLIKLSAAPNGDLSHLKSIIAFSNISYLYLQKF